MSFGEKIMKVLGSWIVFMLISFQTFAEITIQGSGWHLISPGTTQSIETLLNEQPNIQSVWGFKENAWSVKFRTQPTTIPSEWQVLGNFEANRGYWIHTSGAATIAVGQTTLTNFSEFNLNNSSGWQLLGTPSSLTVIDFFASNLPEGGTIWVWENQKWQIYTKGDTGEVNQYNSINSFNSGNLRTIGANQGFWINSSTISAIPEVFVQIPAGVFTMGNIQGGGESDESPSHSVTLSPDFLISDREVMALEYKGCVDAGACTYGDDNLSNSTYGVSGKENHPMNAINRAEIIEYIAWKNQNSAGNGYRLCTEAEWEYVARAGTTSKWSCGSNQLCLLSVAWYGTNSSGTTHEVKTRQPNSWGIYDMHGNVSEAVADLYAANYYSTVASGVVNPTGGTTGTNYVRRGGSFLSPAELGDSVRSADRDFLSASNTADSNGFRLCRTK